MCFVWGAIVFVLISAVFEAVLVEGEANFEGTRTLPGIGLGLFDLLKESEKGLLCLSFLFIYYTVFFTVSLTSHLYTNDNKLSII